MNTRLLSLGAAALVLAACASPGGAVKPSTAKLNAEANEPACLTQTGSRLANPDGHCTAYGRVITGTDIERTGATTPADALQLLDPSVTVHR